MTNRNCFPFGCTGVLAFVFGIWFLTEAISYSRNQETINGNCTIENVVYTRDIHDTENMVVCDCGRNCKSNEGMCLSVFGTFSSNNQKIKTYGKFAMNVNDKLTTCTYQEKHCKEVPRSNALKEIYARAEPFIKLKNTSNTIDCYYNSDVIYLNNYYDINLFITSCVLFSLFCLCCCFCGIVIYCEKNEFCKNDSNI